MIALCAGWKDRFAKGDFEALAADAGLMTVARPAAARLFVDNCAACHGAEGQGRDGHCGTGFPALDDGDWLRSTDPADIAQLICVGVNNNHPETNSVQIMGFGRDGMLSRAEIEQLVPYVIAFDGTADPDIPAATLFADNCASCHGERGEGGMSIGAPS